MKRQQKIRERKILSDGDQKLRSSRCHFFFTIFYLYFSNMKKPFENVELSDESDETPDFDDEWEPIVRRGYDLKTKVKILRSYANLLVAQMKAETELSAGPAVGLNASQAGPRSGRKRPRGPNSEPSATPPTVSSSYEQDPSQKRFLAESNTGLDI